MNRTTQTLVGVAAGALVGAAAGFHVAARWAFAVLTAPDPIGHMTREMTRCPVCNHHSGIHDADCHRGAQSRASKRVEAEAARVWSMPPARRERWLRHRGIDRY